jgi:phosphate transport system permease protein
VPSIVFGLLGAAVFINYFHLPLSAPLAGGLVLSLMTLPTVIIATRAALRAVPPSLRQAALGLGASKTQTVFHHVLPVTYPGILTATIIGVAQAIGETAPLLLIGMNAFVTTLPVTPLDQSTALPVQIFLWEGNENRNYFEPKTAAAIIILLSVMLALNAIAIVLRSRFERRA